MNLKFDIAGEKRWFRSRKSSNKLLFILIGILSTLWFIIRVVPKPSRATYPCMQAAAPFAAAFITYISGLLISLGAIRYIRASGKSLNVYISALAFIVLSIGIILMIGGNNSPGLAGNEKVVADDPPNEPIGIARGIFPGRVVWVWNPDATDETCTNTAGDYWFQDDNVNSTVVEEIFSKSLQLIAGEDTDSLAWDALFRSYNESHGNGNVGYQPGQKIAIKINLTTGGWGNIDLATYDKINNLEMMDGTPQLVVALLSQLIDIFGINEEDISIGDPIRNFYNQYWDRCHSLYPDVKYLDWHGYLGRTKVIKSAGPAMFYSDGTISDSLPTAYLEADYMINMGCLKQHGSAGGTFCAKNHFGSICRDWAMHLHYSLPSPTVNGFENLGYGKFRNLVDLMEHKDLGEKTILFIIDGIWGGEFAVTEPVKWQIDPFNDDWPNSIFMSQDHVAIESVGIDFVRAQFDEYADMLGADDYLHQAADSTYWAEGITYDPDGDGQLIHSLGVHEHWNNDVDKEYTRNLGIGDGIELVKYLMTGIEEGKEVSVKDVITFPNPCRDILTIRYQLLSGAKICIRIFDAYGTEVYNKSLDHSLSGIFKHSLNIEALPPGIYTYRIQNMSNKMTGILGGKIIRIK